MSPRVVPATTTPAAVAWRIALGVFLLLAATAAGRITSSDEYTMYLLTRSLVDGGGVAVPAGNAEPGPDGKLYAKAGVGQAMAATPFYAAGRLAAGLLPRRWPADLVVRGFTSLLNAVVTAALAAVVFLLASSLGSPPRMAFFWSLAVVFSTPLWVYAKSFQTEPLLALGLVAGLYGALRFRDGGDARWAGLAGLAWGFAVLVKYAILPAVILVALPFAGSLGRMRAGLPGLVAAGACGAIAALYNIARTGSALGSGYGRQGTLAAFSTPLLVGLYGLLFSSGKGVVWFAPLTFLVPGAFAAARRRLGAPAWGIALACGVTTVLYAAFEHWAGDGSWGPRYLVPLVPLALVLVIAAHAQTPWVGRGRAMLLGGLAAAGLAVQVGGVGIYYGAQMREAGDYPYTRSLGDPLFMAESHFVPSHSPILEHPRMLARNLRAHLAGDWPRFRPVRTRTFKSPEEELGTSTVERERLAVAPEDVSALTRALDFWWTYAAYAGLPRLPLLAMAAATFVAAGLALARAWVEVRRLEVRPLDVVPDMWVA